jgi:hypothetical protein
MGKRKAPVLVPEATARKVAAMALGRATARWERAVALARLIVGFQAPIVDPAVVVHRRGILRAKRGVSNCRDGR